MICTPPVQTCARNSSSQSVFQAGIKCFYVQCELVMNVNSDSKKYIHVISMYIMTISGTFHIEALLAKCASGFFFPLGKLNTCG